MVSFVDVAAGGVVVCVCSIIATAMVHTYYALLTPLAWAASTSHMCVDPLAVVLESRLSVSGWLLLRVYVCYSAARLLPRRFALVQLSSVGHFALMRSMRTGCPAQCWHATAYEHTTAAAATDALAGCAAGLAGLAVARWQGLKGARDLAAALVTSEQVPELS